MGSVAVSIVAFNGKEVLPRCLDSVLSQTYDAITIHLLDNASSDGTVRFVSEAYPTVEVLSSDVNLGFAAGHNAVIRKTRSSFVLALNQDAYLSKTFVEELVSAMRAYPDVGIAGGKLLSLRPSGNAHLETSNVVDMTWLDIEKKRRQVCYAQGQVDKEEPLSPSYVFAIDGAAMLLRRSTLRDLEIDSQFFDEDFFAGKEDLDISWRAQLLGWKCLYVPTAVGHHLRTFTPNDRRAEISDSLRVASIRNRYLLMVKNDLLPHFLRHFLSIALYDIKVIGYVLLREQSSFKGYVQFVRLLPKAKRKRKIIMQRRKADSAYMLKWFR